MAKPALLVDAGALIAVVDYRGQYHDRISTILLGARLRRSDKRIFANC
jgi:hypothetical protein